MNWKKLVLYIFIIWLIATIGFVIWAHRGLIRMYGGLTEPVDTQQFDVVAEPLLIQGVQVLSPDGRTFIPDQNVSIDNGLIVSIDSVPPAPAKPVKTIDGAGRYLIPGLTDAHVHLFKSPNDLLLYIANGVTQIRELIGEEDHLKWKQQIEAGRIGPDMYVASPRLGSFEMMEGWFMSWSQGFDNIPNAEMAQKAVKAYAEKGYDGIKIYSQLNSESYHALCEAAAAIGMPVMGHVPFTTPLADIYRSSQSEISHFEEVMNALNREFDYFNADKAEEYLAFVDSRCEDVANNLIKHDIYVTSTMWGTENIVRHKFDLEQFLSEVQLAYVNPGLAEWSAMVPRGGLGWLPAVNRFQLPDDLTEEQIAGRRKHWETYAKAEQLIASRLIKSGVKIMAGTDASLPLIVPGFSLHDELESLHHAGMSKAQVLRSATVVPAEWMGTNTGSIEAGRKANLLLLDQNPMEDIRNTRTINTVILNGRVLDRDMLDRMLAAVRQANDSSRREDISAYLKSDQ